MFKSTSFTPLSDECQLGDKGHEPGQQSPGQIHSPPVLERILSPLSTSKRSSDSSEREEMRTNDAAEERQNHMSNLKAKEGEIACDNLKNGTEEGNKHLPMVSKIVRKILADYEDLEEQNHDEKVLPASDDHRPIVSVHESDWSGDFPGKTARQLDPTDRLLSDDLSSRHFDDLIDGDVDSDCTAMKEHKEGRQYLRDCILGVNDGLVSTFLLVSGVRGGGFSSTDILLTVIAGSVAGAVSMCAGEFVATKSQNELTKGEIATEKRHIQEYKKEELMEVSKLLELIGIGANDRELKKRLIRHYACDQKALLKIMIALELGFLEEEERTPIMAGLVSFFLFLAGAFPSVFPFMIPNIDPNIGFIVAGVATSISLLIVGAVKTWATNGNCLTSALENLFIAGFGGAVAFGAGALTAVFVHEE